MDLASRHAQVFEGRLDHFGKAGGPANVHVSLADVTDNEAQMGWRQVLRVLFPETDEVKDLRIPPDSDLVDLMAQTKLVGSAGPVNQRNVAPAGRKRLEKSSQRGYTHAGADQ